MNKEIIRGKNIHTRERKETNRRKRMKKASRMEGNMRTKNHGIKKRNNNNQEGKDRDWNGAGVPAMVYISGHQCSERRAAPGPSRRRKTQNRRP